MNNEFYVATQDDMSKRKFNGEMVPEGLSDIDSVNDTKSLHNRAHFMKKNGQVGDPLNNFDFNPDNGQITPDQMM